MAIEDYFPSALKLTEELKNRKQSLYLEPSESKTRLKSECSQEEGPPERFRARSGTDISNSVLSARLKYRRLHSLNTDKTNMEQVRESTLVLAESMAALDKQITDENDEVMLTKWNKEDKENITNTDDTIITTDGDIIMTHFVDTSVEDPNVDATNDDVDYETEYEDCQSRKPSTMGPEGLDHESEPSRMTASSFYKIL